MRHVKLLGIALTLALVLTGPQALAAATKSANPNAAAATKPKPKPDPFAQLEVLVMKERAQELRLERSREERFRKKMEHEQALAAMARRRRDRDQARASELNKEWEANHKKIAELKVVLNQAKGNLGELFGVTREVASDAANHLQRSLITVQYEKPGIQGRSKFLRQLASAKALPSMQQLERLWFELQREMIAQGQVVKFDTKVKSKNGSTHKRQVVRIGSFTAVSDGHFLHYNAGTKMFQTLPVPIPYPRLRSIARQFQQAKPGNHYAEAVVDPASGGLITTYDRRPDVLKRISLGGDVAYVIVSIGSIGAILAIFQFFYLLRTEILVRRQLESIDKPVPTNPLGRLLLVADTARAARTDVAELHFSEAILREIPKIERFQSFLRLVVAAGPLLGLIGTVIGMIITFHAITATSSSSPTLMANGIGQAMINTALGLGVAIPLLFATTGLMGRSRAIIQTLDEHLEILLAKHVRESEAH